MIYTSTQLIDDFRSDVFDAADKDDAGTARDTLWSDADILRYMNQACHQYAGDTLALRKVMTFSVAVNNPLVTAPLDEILDVITASYSVPAMGRRRSLLPFDIDEGIVYEDYGNVYTSAPDLDAVGTPTHYTRDYTNASIRLWRVPPMAGTLTINAHVLPPEIYAGAPIPFPAPRDRALVLCWMKKLAYEKQDADVLDLDRAKAFETEYQRYMPNRRSEIDRLRRDNAIMRPN